MSENGKHYRRNRKSLNKSRDTLLILPDDSEQNVTHVKESDNEQLEPALNQTEENEKSVVPAHMDHSLTLQDVPPRRMSTREKRQPSWMKDYVSK